jgi:hypothetical protein
MEIERDDVAGGAFNDELDYRFIRVVPDLTIGAAR